MRSKSMSTPLQPVVPAIPRGPIPLGPGELRLPGPPARVVRLPLAGHPQSARVNGVARWRGRS